MKNLISKIGQNKFQFFFFVGMVAVLLIAIIISSSIDNNVDEPIISNPPTDIIKPSDDPVDTIPEETLKLPFSENMEYSVVRKFYDKNASKEDQLKALIKFGNSYRTSSGTSFANKDNSTFDVLSSMSGKITEIKTSPLYGNYVIVEHNDDLKTFYYGLDEVFVQVGTSIKQGEKIGTSGLTDIDKEAGNHLYFLVKKSGKYLNPEVLIGKKISEI